jgi:hypothetical protein
MKVDTKSARNTANLFHPRFDRRLLRVTVSLRGLHLDVFLCGRLPLLLVRSIPFLGRRLRDR